MSFDFPDTMPSKEVQYATYIPARQPAFKVHNTQGLANSAVGQRNWNEPWAKYELQGGDWVKVDEYQPPTNCSMCGNQFNRWDNGKIIYHTSVAKVAKYKKRPICSNCYNTQRAQQRREEEEQRDLAELRRLSTKYGK